MKFSLEWLSDYVDATAAGGSAAVRALLDRAGFPIESVEGEGAGTIFDVEITPNRPDAMNHRGLAREIAAMAGLALKSAPPARLADSGPDARELTSVTIEVPRLCRRFGARVVRGVSAAAAPDRLRARLAAIGAKPISAAVDATNYVMWEIGQPLHVFDLDRLAGGRIVVRRARRGEKLVTLDGIQRDLDPSDIVVADAERAVSLAGVMGGLDTAVTSATKNVLLEAAWWDPPSIRRTSRRLGLHTDASHRFERGADPEAIPEALDRAAAILLESAGGTLAPGFIDARGAAWKIRRAALRLSRLRLLAGTQDLDIDFAAEVLARLGFVLGKRSGRRLAVTVPSWRPDVSIEDDLVEEVLRIYGYDRLPSRLPPGPRAGGHLEPLRVIEERLSDGAAAAGLLETMSAPFVDRRSDEGAYSAWLAAAGSAPAPLSLANPLDETRRDLRATLLPGLLDAAARNVHRGQRDVALFEVGRVFDRAGDPEGPASFESRRFAFALSGEARPHWSSSGAAARADFFDAKGLTERLLSPWLDAGTLAWKPFSCDAFATDAAALVESADGKTLGVVGLVSSSEREKRKLTDDVFAVELRVDAIPSPRAVLFQPFSPYPPIEADLSFAHAKSASWRQIEEIVSAAKLADLESVRVLDRYEGRGVPQGQVKTTIR
ncbi:MAG TPA: phenylalanine--tRNA ligase subunit beta, partial [Thermoanaerobaculia bacterium]|nr:phenylalanine--tRNA ligase subunit beta [Thermoanaerobaculia bacterium]